MIARHLRRWSRAEGCSSEPSWERRRLDCCTYVASEMGATYTQKRLMSHTLRATPRRQLHLHRHRLGCFPICQTIFGAKTTSLQQLTSAQLGACARRLAHGEVSCANLCRE